MVDKKLVTGILMDESTTVSFIEICEDYNIPQKMVTEMIEHGLIRTGNANIKQQVFDYQTLARIQSAHRLHKDLGINMSGIALAFDLLDELESLRNELDILQRQVDDK